MFYWVVWGWQFWEDCRKGIPETKGQVTSESIGMFARLICPWLFSHESVLKPGLGLKQFILCRWFGRINQCNLIGTFFRQGEHISSYRTTAWSRVSNFFFKCKAVCEKGKREPSLKILPFHKNLSCSFHNPKSGIMAKNRGKITLQLF